MSAILENEGVEIVKITLKKKSDASTLTYYLGESYYPASSIYSGLSNTVYPILAAPVRTTRAAGVNMGIKSDISVALYSHVPLDDKEKALFDLSDEYDLQGAMVEILFYAKPTDTFTTTNSNETRGTYEVYGWQYDGSRNIIKLICRDSWFKDRSYGSQINEDDLSGAIQEGWDKEYLSYLFAPSGTGKVVSTPVYDADTFGDQYGDGNLIGGWFAGTFPSNDYADGLYVENAHRQFNKDSFFKVDVDTYGHGSPSQYIWSNDDRINKGVSYSFFNLQDYSRAIVDSPRNHNTASPPTPDKGVVLCKAGIRIKTSGTFAATEGQVTIKIYHAQFDSVTGYQPKGSIISQGVFDIDSSTWATANTTETKVFAHLSPFPTLHPDGDYMFVIEWSNPNSTIYPLLGIYNETAAIHYAKDLSTNKANFVAQNNVGAGIILIPLGHERQSGDMRASNLDGPVGYAKLENPDVSVALGSGRDATNDEPYSIDNLTFKTTLYGLADTAGGTYTGTAYQSISKACDIIYYFLIGVLGISNFDSSNLTTLRTQCRDLIVDVNGQTSIEALITEICRQARLQFYKKANGNLAIRYPVYTVTPDHYIYEVDTWGDLQIVGNDGGSQGYIVNAYKTKYDSENIISPNDSFFLRDTQRIKLNEEIILNKDTATLTEPGRQATATVSESLYQRKEAEFNFNFLATQSDAQDVANYYFDRYHKARRKVTFSVPRWRYFRDIELFDVVLLDHSSLADSNGTTTCVRTHDDGAEEQWYENGHPVDVMAAGHIRGEVVQIQEQGQLMIITIEEVLPYS